MATLLAPNEKWYHKIPFFYLVCGTRKHHLEIIGKNIKRCFLMSSYISLKLLCIALFTLFVKQFINILQKIDCIICFYFPI